MKKKSMLITILLAIIAGIIISTLGHRKSNEPTETEKINKIYSLMNEANNSLDELSENYLKVFYRIEENRSVSKIEIAKIINIDYEKFFKDTKNINKDKFINLKEGIECLNEYYKNAGILDNIKNKFKSIKSYLNIMNPISSNESKIYIDLKSIYGQMIEYYDAIINENIASQLHKQNIIKYKDSIKLKLDTAIKKEITKWKEGYSANI